MIPSGARIVGGMPAIAAAFAVAALLPSSATLSDEWSTSTWAHPAANAPVRSAPSGDAHAIARLHAKTGEAASSRST